MTATSIADSVSSRYVESMSETSRRDPDPPRGTRRARREAARPTQKALGPGTRPLDCHAFRFALTPHRLVNVSSAPEAP